MSLVFQSNLRNRRQLLRGLGLAGAMLATRASGMNPTKQHAATEDGVRWVKLSNGHRVWTRRVGRGATKVLLLHGGPGLSHDYLQCFEHFLPQAGVKIYFYDQLGCGHSDRPNDPHFWTIPRYVQEVEEVRKALGLEQFVLYGHSWGGILGIEYALRYQKHLAGFILSNMTASIADYVAHLRYLRAQLPLAVRKELDRLEAEGSAGEAAFDAVVERELYSRYVLRLKPWPQPVQHSFETVNAQIYNQMQGANEFVVTGNLLGWDRWKDLHEIVTPALVMGAKYDEMNPASVAREASLLPHSNLFISERGSHLSMWDDQNAYFRAVLDFLKKLQGG